jgi:hypothetical protein
MSIETYFHRNNGTIWLNRRLMDRGEPRGLRIFKRIIGHNRQDAVLQDLMNYLGRDVWNYAYFLTGRFDVADDVFQDVFVKVYRNLFSFRGESSRTQGAQSLDQMI